MVPYVKATFGPVYIESEFGYAFGTAKEYESPSVKANEDYQAWSGYLHAKVKFGPAYAGAQVGYIAGDDFQDETKNKSAFNAKTVEPHADHDGR